MTTSVTVYLAPAPINVTQFIPGGNTPANGAQLFAYAAGSSNKQNTYTTSSGSVAWSNPIILDSGGNLTGSKEVWLTAGQTYDFVLAPSTDQDPPISPYWTVHSITGINDTTVTSTEWIGLGSTATFVNASTFTVNGDATGTLTSQRRLKTVNTAGTFYATVTSSIFGTSTTTIGIQSDSTGLDSGLSAVNYGLLSTKNDSIPYIVEVTRFGVKGDGVTDDTAAIQNAINSLDGTNSGGFLKFPSGTFLITAPLTATKNLKIIGSGLSDAVTSTGTTIKAKTGWVGASLLSSAGARYVIIKDITLDGNSLATNSLKIDGPSVVAFLLEHVRLIGATTDSFSLAPTNATQVSESRASLCVFGGTPTNSQVKVNSTNEANIIFDGCNFQGGGSYNFHLLQSNGVNLISCTFNSATVADIFFGSESARVQVLDCETESVSSTIFLSAPSYGGPSAYSNQGSLLMNVYDAVTRTTAINYAQARPLTIIESNFAGNVTITSPATLFFKGLRFTSGSLGGTGTVVGLRSPSDAVPSSTLADQIYTGALFLDGGTAGSVSQPQLRMTNNKILSWQDNASSFTNAGFIWYDSSNNLNFGTGNNTRLSISSTALFSYSGQTVTAGASTATLTNSPHAGNPTAWPRININGSTLCFPCFPTT